jgi:hypothetical protein
MATPVYKFLYDVVEGENGVERVLKPMFRGKQQHCAFVAGVDITAAMLGRYANGTGKEMTGRTIWDIGKKVHLMVKKAQSLIRMVGFVQVDSTGWICGFARVVVTCNNFINQLTMVSMQF